MKLLIFLIIPLIFAIKNPTQSQNGGANQMYERSQQAAEHYFLAFPHKMTDFEHQNPYIVSKKLSEELTEKKKEYEQEANNHEIFSMALDDELKEVINSQDNYKMFENIINNNKESQFDYKLNPKIGNTDSNDSYIDNILIQSEKIYKDNELKRGESYLKYAKRELDEVNERIKNKGNLTLSDVLSPIYNSYGLNINEIPENLLKKQVLSEDVSKISISESIESKKEENELKNGKISIKDFLKNREANGKEFKGLHSLFPGGSTKLKEKYKNGWSYNGWIHPHEIPYFDKLYIEGFFNNGVYST